MLLQSALLIATGAWTWQAQAATTGSLTVQAKGSIGAVVSGAGQLSIGGDTPVTVGVAHVSGGNATVVAGPDSALPKAVQFPSYVAAGTYPRAVLSLTPSSGWGLSPGTADFSFGAVLRLDDTPSERPDDNGDNAFQRGLTAEADMFKLQMDHARPACTVRGSSGRVIVRSATTVSPHTWYSVTCARVGTTVTVTTTPYGSTASAKAMTTTSASGSTGTVDFASTRPAAVGGKLTAGGDVAVDASDQFNGAIAQVWTRRS